ncbi:DinB family protein [Pseudoduganella ginsengisoli]|uniref:Damage-inducible protein DinB n=1 Tax=Pseudoduganella ginsengisoli TaxID=1462440 RepID=A0A6L6PXR2_9BURK|nr:DinB family protein [Pseudoduganella ginsengisoli]MTW02240.1 damage-inducible protein DinB [Pseudoduganella ginsengisoli]
MASTSYVRKMAEYNAWMNAKVYEAAARLPPAELAQDRGAFFGSILGTLNHLVVADTIWLKRFAAHPAQFTALDPVRALALPQQLNAVLFTDLAEMTVHRVWLDGVISAFADALTEADLASSLHYANTKGVPFTRQLGGVMMHFFNHQTHHRGQVSTLLTQAGVDIGVTDLLLLIPDAL